MSDQPIERAEQPQAWYVYLLGCSDHTFYCGVTTDLDRRMRQHNGELVGGARYTRPRRPVKLLWYEIKEGRSAASAREAEIKRLSRGQKEQLIKERKRSAEHSAQQ